MSNYNYELDSGFDWCLSKNAEDDDTIGNYYDGIQYVHNSTQIVNEAADTLCNANESGE